MKFSKFWGAFAAVSLLVASAFFVSCHSDSDSSSHEHTFATEWEKNATHHWHAATCEHADEVKDKAEHNFGEWKITTQPKENAEGKKERECSVCHYKVEETIAKLDHTHAKGTHHDAVAGTCQKKGTIEHYDCVKETCEVKLDTDGNPLTSTEGEYGSHVLGTKHDAVAGTCVKKGTIEYYECANTGCKVNLDKDSNVLSSTDGDLTPTNHEGTATWKKTAETHIETYDCCDAVKTEEAAHNFGEWTIKTPATTGADGLKERTCLTCGYLATEIIAKLDIPEGFVKVAGVTITGTETWTPESEVFVSGRKLTIPTLIVCDHEVTRGEFKAVMGTDPSTASAYNASGTKLRGDAVLNNPVNYVNWYDAIAYCNKLSIKENLTPCYSVSSVTDWATLAYSSIPTSSNTNWNNATCNFEADGYRLPTEAEWEWLARGGENYTYAGSKTVGDVAWYTSNTEGSREVKTKQKNGYGLYDMSGNVCEWCWDWYGSINSTTAATGAASGSGRVRRGGSWCSIIDNFCAVADRDYDYPYDRYKYLGFRVCRSSSVDNASNMYSDVDEATAEKVRKLLEKLEADDDCIHPWEQ